MKHFAIALVTVMVLASTASANGLDCLRLAQGKTIKWNSSWQSDGQDGGVAYRVTRIGESIRSSQGLRMTLEAMETAQLPSRTIDISDNLIARQVCLTIERTSRSPFSNLGETTPAPKTDTTRISSSRRDFIKYTATGWLRADPPKAAALTTCQVLHYSFSCLEEEKRRYGDQLKSIAEEMQAEVAY